MTPNPSENYEKSEGYFFRPFRNVDNSNFSNFSKLKQVLIPSLSANVDISEGAIRPQAHHDGELVTANHDGEQLAERRIGQFSQELEKQQGGETRFGTHHYGENQTKTQTLKDVGIDIAHASRYGLTPLPSPISINTHLVTTYPGQDIAKSEGYFKEHLP